MNTNNNSAINIASGMLDAANSQPYFADAKNEKFFPIGKFTAYLVGIDADVYRSDKDNSTTPYVRLKFRLSEDMPENANRYFEHTTWMNFNTPERQKSAQRFSGNLNAIMGGAATSYAEAFEVISAQLKAALDQNLPGLLVAGYGSSKVMDNGKRYDNLTVDKRLDI